jgi:YidC/Oxa1 family membrane protein insertase
MKKYQKIFVLVFCLLLLTGCTKILKNTENKPVKNVETGQVLTENIICKPTNESTIKTYEENGIDIDSLPACSKFSPIGHYEGLWTSLFVKPLAWVIIKIGQVLKSYGLSLIATCLIIRFILYPFTKKTAMQSELIKKAQPELNKLEKKYENKTSAEDQNKKAQEMMLIYQKYKINPVSGCLLAFIQLPLLLAFYEAIQRTPAIFEDKFLFFELGKTPGTAIKGGEYLYIILVILIFVATLFSFRKTLKDQSNNQAMNMKTTLYFMLAIITVSSFTIASAVGIYWITSNVFTIIQNLLVERKKVK